MAPMRPVIRVGTDFSGMDMPIFALANMNVDFTQVLACDVDPACRRLIKHVHKAARVYADIVTRPFFEWDATDLYIWGAPCQPFSTAGKNRGAKDRRCLAMHALRYMKQHRPRAVLMENMSGLVKRHRQVFNKIKSIMSSLGYEVHARLINTENHGIPHRRVRLYMVALLREPGTGRKFSWPTPVPACNCRRALAPIGPYDKPGGLPPRDMRKGKRAYRECIANRIDPRTRDVFVDIGCTEKFYHKRLDALEHCCESEEEEWVADTWERADWQATREDSETSTPMEQEWMCRNCGSVNWLFQQRCRDCRKPFSPDRWA